MPKGGVIIIRRPPVSTCEKWRLMDHSDKNLFRQYRGKIPREGYDINSSNPLVTVKDRTAPTPLRGC
jgi:hypothetical protein